MFSRHNEKEEKLNTQHYEIYKHYEAIYKQNFIEKEYRE